MRLSDREKKQTKSGRIKSELKKKKQKKGMRGNSSNEDKTVIFIVRNR